MIFKKTTKVEGKPDGSFNAAYETQFQLSAPKLGWLVKVIVIAVFAAAGIPIVI